MYVRLGFAVAVHVDPDILLVDEVLAVGDEAFSRKCLDRIAQFQQDGRTILFVSHALDLVERICDRCVVLHRGQAVYDGDPEWATGTLRGLLGVDQPARAELSDPGLAFEGVRYTAGPEGPVREEFAGGEPLCLRVLVTIDPDTARTAEVDFIIEELPPVLGRLVPAVSLSESAGPTAIAAHTFTEGINVKGGGQRTGLLWVPHRVAANVVPGEGEAP
jgi:ABC-2 type transport system ATP-binding protein